MEDKVNSKKINNRIISIDIMRGLTLLLMLFVNDLYDPGVPDWLVHTKADVDGMGLADWVFPGFLFMVGLSVPFAFASRKKKGETNWHIFVHIVVRTISLLIIGVMMLNGGRLNSELSGINRFLWSILVFVFIFLIWNKYPDNKEQNTRYSGLKILGIIGLTTMAIIFRSGNPDNVQWLQIGWWGILGLIGWGYFTAAVSFLMVGSRLWGIIGIWLFFMVLNILSQLGLLEFLNFLKPIFGVIIDGNVPFLVITGLIVGLLLKKLKDNPVKLLLLLALFSVLSLVGGYILHHWFIISKIYGTPSWASICNGISILVFAILFYLVDILKKDHWVRVLLPAGQNSLTTYLVPTVIYYLLWWTSLPILFYKQGSSQILAVSGSLCWAFAMVGLAVLLSKIHIRLKL